MSSQSFVKRLLAQSSMKRSRQPEDDNSDDEYSAALEEVSSGLRSNSAKKGKGKSSLPSSSKPKVRHSAQPLSGPSKPSKKLKAAHVVSPSPEPASPEAPARGQVFRVMHITFLFRSMDESYELTDIRAPSKTEIMKSFVPHGLAKQNISSGFPIHSNWSSQDCDTFIRNLLPGPFAYLEHLESSGSAILTFESRINGGSEPTISHNLSWLPCIWDRSSLSTYLDEPTGHGLQFCKGNATAVWRNAGIFIVPRVILPNEIKVKDYKKWYNNNFKSIGKRAILPMPVPVKTEPATEGPSASKTGSSSEPGSSKTTVSASPPSTIGGFRTFKKGLKTKMRILSPVPSKLSDDDDDDDILGGLRLGNASPDATPVPGHDEHSADSRNGDDDDDISVPAVGHEIIDITSSDDESLPRLRRLRRAQPEVVTESALAIIACTSTPSGSGSHPSITPSVPQTPPHPVPPTLPDFSSPDLGRFRNPWTMSYD